MREYWDAANKDDGTGKAITHYISAHMQSAIDEATAPLRARIAELEGLGSLIEEYIAEVNRLFYLEDQSGEMLDLSMKIKTILKGGES